MLGVGLHLAAQPRDVDVHGAVEHDHVVGPHMIDELLAAQDLPPVLQHHQEQRILDARERDVLPVDPHLLAVVVEDESLEADHALLVLRLRLLRRAAQHRLDTGQHLAQRERLRDVVVSAEVEALHGVVLRVACGQKDDGRLLRQRVVLHPSGHLETRHLAHHHVQQQQVVGGNVQRQRLFGGVGHVGPVALRLQVELKNLAEVGLVVDHQYAIMLVFHICDMFMNRGQS